MTERQMIQIPKGSKIYNYLYNGRNQENKAKWEILEELAEQMPQSRQERAHKLFSGFAEEFEILYPGSRRALEILWVLIAKRIMKIPDTVTGKEVDLGEMYYEELKKL